jgi:hypothetical protein
LYQSQAERSQEGEELGLPVERKGKTQRMRKLGLIAFALACVSLSSPPQAVASDEVCLKFKYLLLGGKFTAKVPLYDTKVEINGITKLERDKEEVPQGAMLQVLKVECEGDELEVKIRLVSEWKFEATSIYFRFPGKARQLEDPVGDLRKMMGHVFEIPSP